MNVLIITEEDVFYVYEFFKTFFPLSSEAPYRLKAITILPPFNKKSTSALAKQMYGFYGPYQFIRVGFLYVMRKLMGKSIRGLAKKYSLPSLGTAKVNDPQYIQKIKDMDIECIVSIAAPQMFKKELLQAAPKGCINSHSSLLPENKGMMPVFWGMCKGAENIGVTIHYMDESFDNGDIIKQQPVPVDSMSLHQLIMKTKHLSAHLVYESLVEIMNGTITSRPMPTGGSYQTFPTPEEVKEFKKRGKRIF